MKIFRTIFIILGAIFMILILSVVVLIIIKPYGINVIKVVPVILDKNPTSSYDHPHLTTQQESILESMGIDTKNIPTQITESQQQCAVSILGEERANELVSGAIPSTIEILKIKSCFE